MYDERHVMGRTDDLAVPRFTFFERGDFWETRGENKDTSGRRLCHVGDRCRVFIGGYRGCGIRRGMGVDVESRWRSGAYASRGKPACS
ncbi:hypothetical protein QJS10_CPB19g01875 [Acorus calamus]|uniref:Uncharacterized protein n=1 Tax=Acorus calamus TaxID=4465 RepID=A0AAV9CEG4_ACOCL|nr:hypothetical protein QJS10_CPB19g01875 [Acorus calamus]